MTTPPTDGLARPDDFDDPVAVLDLVDGHPDLARVADAAKAARAALDVLQQPLSYVYGASPVRPTVEESCSVFALVVDVLDGAPDEGVSTAHRDAAAAVEKQRGGVDEAARKVRELLGRDDVAFEALSDADEALALLRSCGMASLAGARAALEQAAAESGSRAAVALAWSTVRDRLRLRGGPSVSSGLRDAALQVVALGSDGLFWLRGLPEGAAESVRAFAAARDAAVALRDDLVAAHGAEWLNHPAKRLRNAAEALDTGAVEHAGVVSQFRALVADAAPDAASASAAMRRMALAKEGLAAAAADVAAAAVLGQAFCGVETDVGPAVEAMARWEWLMGLRGHYREECLLAEALAVKPRGEIVALAALLAAAVAADTRHLEAFGTPWDDPGFDADSVAVFEDCVARIAAVAGSVADPFAAVFHAFRAAAKGERAKAVLAALSGDMPEDPAEVLDRRCAALSHALNALHPGGEFAFRAAQVGDLRAACAAGHAAACGFAEAVVDLCNVADAELVSFDKPIADAADRLRVIEAAPLLLATRRRTAARAAALRMPAAPAGATPAVPSIPDVAMPEGDIWEEFDLHGGRERRPVGGA